MKDYVAINIKRFENEAEDRREMMQLLALLCVSAMGGENIAAPQLGAVRLTRVPVTEENKFDYPGFKAGAWVFWHAGDTWMGKMLSWKVNR